MAQRSARVSFFRWGTQLLLIVLLVGLFPASQAQSDVRYFPETGHYLRGVFRTFWDGNGGLEIFGFPITEEYIAPEDGRIKQYFERARFELVEQPGGQSVVELGRLGSEVTEGRTFPKVPPIENTAQRRYIPETQHIIQYGFKEIWETRGAERIFGFPISEEIQEILEDGDWHTVQYFERAKFEYHPERAPGQRVLISNLGRVLAPPELLPPLPPNAPPSGPVGAPGAPAPAPGTPAPAPAPAPDLPPNVNARVTPEVGPPGTTFAFVAEGFEPGESVGIWLTAPDQSTFGADFQAVADDNGSIANENVAITTNQDFADGIWSFNAQGVRSNQQAVGYFRISRVAGGAVGDPNRLGIVAHDELSVQGEAIILPVAAPAGTPFEFLAAGYEDEEVSSWITDQEGNSTEIDESSVFVEDGVAFVSFVSAGFGNGIYTTVAQGRSSDVLNAASFKITDDYVAGPGTARPANINGSVTPAEGGVGTVFQLRGQNLQPNEEIELWLTDPTGVYVLFPDTGFADDQGRIGYEPPLDLEATADLVPGVYGVHFRGRSSGTRIGLYFTYTGSGALEATPFESGIRLIDQIATKGSFPQSDLWQR